MQLGGNDVQLAKGGPGALEVLPCVVKGVSAKMLAPQAANQLDPFAI